jgi:hypothetical protein
MLNRLLFILIAVFWLAMNFLLWRAEYGDQSAISSAVPPAVVWEKILNCPDHSTLSIQKRGQRIGQCSLQTSVSEEFSTLEDAPQKGIKAGNRVRLEGSLSMPERRGRIRFESDVSLSDNEQWERFRLRISRRGAMVEVESEAAKQTVHLKATDGEAEFDRVFTFSEFKNPMALLNGFLDPIAAGMMAGFDPVTLFPPPTETDEPLLVWHARNDTLNIGHEPVRVYRLQTRVLERYNIVIHVSRAGEILKVELPHGIVLIHDRLRVN